MLFAARAGLFVTPAAAFLILRGFARAGPSSLAERFMWNSVWVRSIFC